jgi:hypothetical protein
LRRRHDLQPQDLIGQAMRVRLDRPILQKCHVSSLTYQTRHLAMVRTSRGFARWTTPTRPEHGTNITGPMVVNIKVEG